jgi:hypothetical protein
MLIKNKLNPENAGSLFREKKADYDGIWCRSIYELKITSKKTVDATTEKYGNRTTTAGISSEMKKD